MTHTTTREKWSYRTGFILAATGGAIGIGNIWKFPYMAGSSGGGAFIIVYLFAVALVAELMLGRYGGASAGCHIFTTCRSNRQQPVYNTGYE